METEQSLMNEIDTPEEAEVEKEKLAGSRKLVVTGVVLAVGVAIALFKGDIPEHLLQLLEVVFGGFIVGNVAGHALGTAVEHAEIKYAPIGAGSIEPDAPVKVSVPVSTQVSYELQSIEKALISQAQSIDLVQQTLLMIIKKSGLDK